MSFRSKNKAKIGGFEERDLKLEECVGLGTQFLPVPTYNGDALQQDQDQDQGKGRGKVRILSIDGGGIRGIIPVTILGYLEDALQRKSGKPDARIADYFDLVAGTSVGAIIATMMFTGDSQRKPLFTGKQTCDLLSEEMRRIFQISWIKRPLGGIMAPKYSTKKLEEVLKRHLIGESGEPFTLKDCLKPILIPCYNLVTAQPLIFSRADAEQTDSSNFRLWEVCRAACAVPSFFKPMELYSVNKSTHCVALDGGLVINNPTATAITHVLHNKREFPDVATVQDMLVLSLGTGQFDQSYEYSQVKGWGGSQWIRPIFKIIHDGLSRIVDYNVSMAFGNNRINYVRIQCSKLPGSFLKEMEDASEFNIKRLKNMAETMLNEQCKEHLPSGSTHDLHQTNKDRLDWFVDQLLEEQKNRPLKK